MEATFALQFAVKRGVPRRHGSHAAGELHSRTQVLSFIQSMEKGSSGLVNIAQIIQNYL
jgi:hypothetical protein